MKRVLISIVLGLLFTTIHAQQKETIMKANKLTPNFEVGDIKQTVEFYTDMLGFQLVMAVPETQDGVDQQFKEGTNYVYALVRNEDVEVMFQRSDSFHEDVSLAQKKAIGASISFYFEIEGLDKLYNNLKNKEIQITEPKIAWYGMKEFYITDNNGYVLGFGEKIDK